MERNGGASWGKFFKGKKSKLIRQSVAGQATSNGTQNLVSDQQRHPNLARLPAMEPNFVVSSHVENQAAGVGRVTNITTIGNTKQVTLNPDS